MTENGNFRAKTRRRKGMEFIGYSFFSAPLRLVGLEARIKLVEEHPSP
jgi:hypothetical protein